MGNVNREGSHIIMQSRIRHSQPDSRSQRKLIACLLLDLKADSPLESMPTPSDPPFQVWSRTTLTQSRQGITALLDSLLGLSPRTRQQTPLVRLLLRVPMRTCGFNESEPHIASLGSARVYSPAGAGEQPYAESNCVESGSMDAAIPWPCLDQVRLG
jgi:hypothetical protein